MNRKSKVNYLSITFKKKIIFLMKKKAPNLLNQPILQQNTKGQETCIIARGFPSYVLYSIFDYEHGPTQIYTNAPPNMIDDSFSMYLFPSKWAENEIFAFEHNGIYSLSMGIVSPNIVHARGTIHTTVALISQGVAFGQKHYDFLVETSESLRNIKPPANESNQQHDFLSKFDFNSFFRPIYEKYDLNTPFDVLHPLFPFVKNNTTSNFFANRPETLLALWRFRMCRYKIVIACSQKVSTATDLSYFIAAMCLPFCKVDNGECAFHIDMADNEQYVGTNSNRKSWLVCAVTHQMMQSDLRGDVAIDHNGFLTVHSGKDLHWLMKGKGPIVHQLEEIMKQNRGDDVLLRRLIDLTCSVMELGNKNTIVDESMMKEIGLDKKNANFLSYLYSTNHCNAQIGTMCNCC